HVGGTAAAVVLNLVEQPDDLAAPNAANRPLAKGRVDVLGQGALALALGAQLVAFAGEVFPADGLQGVGGSGRRLCPGALAGLARIDAAIEFERGVGSCLAGGGEREPGRERYLARPAVVAIA